MTESLFMASVRVYVKRLMMGEAIMGRSSFLVSSAETADGLPIRCSVSASQTLWVLKSPSTTATSVGRIFPPN